MKIPVYNPQINASTVQYNAVADIRTNTLGEMADGLQQYGKFREAQLEEERQTERFKADSAIKYELEDAHSKMIDAIQNGGAYADAETKYQKTFDETLAKYMPMMGNDENVTERARAEYQRYGLGHTVQLRNAVQQRRKGDALQSADLLGQQAEQMFITDPQKAIQMYSSALAGARSVGAINDDGAKAKLMTFVQAGKAREMELVFQNNRDNPQAVADWVEKNKSDLDTDVYLSGREKAQNEIFKFGSSQQVKSFLADPVVYKAPTQESVDIFYEREVAPIGVKNPADYEEATISLAVSTGKLPQQVANQAASYLEMDPSLMNQSDMQTAATNARIISETNKYAAKMSKTNITASTISKANLLVQRMDAGLPIDKALMSVQRDLGTEEGKKLYGASITEARNILLERKLNGTRIRVDVPTYAQADFIQAYATAKMNTANASEAAKMAEDEIDNRYKAFNGVTVRDPATSVSIYDEESWVKASTNKYIEKIGPLKPGQKTIVMADGETRRMIQSQEKPSFALFVSYSKDEPPVPVFDKDTGQPIRIYEDPTAMKTIKKKVFAKGSGIRTYRMSPQNAN